MRPRTVAVVFLLLLALGGAAAVGLGLVDGPGDDVSLSTRWVSDTGREVNANHHAVAAGRVDGTGMVFAPVSGRSNTTQCALYALYANGTRAWTYQISPAACTIHAVADPTLADYDGDGSLEVLAATTEQVVVALSAGTGEVELRHELSSYGYTRPVVANFTGNATPELVVVDAHGTVWVLRPDGSVVWSTALGAYTWGQPAVADFDGDGAPELAVGIGGDGAIFLFEGDGSLTWVRDDLDAGSITWMTTGQTDADEAVEIAVATPRGAVIVLDGARGATEWRRDFGRFTAVHALGDGDEDGAPELYVTAKDGVLYALDAASGATEWTTALTTGDVQMMPPPTLGDLDGDGSPELVAVSNDGIVSVVSPETGSVLARYERDVPIYARPVTADLNADGRDEVYVMYGDGRVVALEIPPDDDR